MASGSQKPDSLNLVINLRERCAGVTKLHAGNYSIMPSVVCDDLSDPVQIREWLNKILQPDLLNWSYPKLTKGIKIGMSTSWVQFYEQVELPGYEHKLHMPILRPFPAHPDGLELSFDFMTIVFVPNRGKLGLLIVSSQNDKDHFLNQQIIKGEIMKV